MDKAPHETPQTILPSGLGDLFRRPRGKATAVKPPRLENWAAFEDFRPLRISEGVRFRVWGLGLQVSGVEVRGFGIRYLGFRILGRKVKVLGL